MHGTVRLTGLIFLSLLLAACGNLARQGDASLKSTPEDFHHGEIKASLKRNDPLWHPPTLDHLAEEEKTENAGLAESPAATESDDLWQRLRLGYRLLDKVEQTRFTDALDDYRQRRLFFERMGEQAEPYLYYIVREVEKRDLPTELALLPAIESAFQPSAHSPAKALGLWQFTPNTGRYFGLTQNWWRDERQDLIASTRAALDYLEKLHGFFDGDWLLALAAYNCGEGTVQKAREKNRRAGRPTDYWSLDLPAETRAFVPGLLAVASIVGDPDSHELSLIPIPNRPYLAPVRVGGQIDLEVAARLAGISTRELRRLNPGFKRWATDPSGPHSLLVPIDKADTFRHRLTALSKDKLMPERENYPGGEAEILTYRIKRGDTLGHIAARHGTQIKVLCELNGISRRTTLRVGKTLMVPIKGKKTATAQKSPGKVVYTVKNGDTLWEIARAHRVSVSQLATWNRISTRSILRRGQTLTIFVSS